MVDNIPGQSHIFGGNHPLPHKNLKKLRWEMKKKRKIGEIKSEIYQNVTFIFKKLGNFLPTSISLNSCLFLYHPFLNQPTNMILLK